MRQRIPIKYCRHCGHVIPLDAAQCPYCDEMVIRTHEQKECPFCGELVKAKALKCKHCGEFLDGRGQEAPQSPQVLQIEKAIIATGGEGSFELTRPDGRVANVAELAPPPRAQVGAGAVPKALPPGGGVAGPLDRGGALVGAQPGARAPVAPPPIRKPPAEPRKGRVEAPPVEMECSSCKHTVFHGDHYCENCGRDLTQSPSTRALKPIAYAFGPSDYALLLGAAAPVGLMLALPYSLLVPASGIALSAWCLLRIRRSEGRLKGIRSAIWGGVLGLFWLALILVAQGL